MPGIIENLASLPFIVPASTSRQIFYPMWDWKEGDRLKELEELEQSQWRTLTKDDVWKKLQSTLKNAFSHCPYYRDGQYRLPSNFLEYESLPILSKDQIRNNLDGLISEQFNKTELMSAKTGGSTGVSLQLYFDNECQVRRNAAAFRSDRWAGWDLGEAKGALWGNPPMVKTWKNLVRHHLWDRTVYLDTLKLEESSFRSFVNVLKKNDIQFLFGHSHSLFIFANYIRSQKIDLPMKGIVSTSMMLLSNERVVIEDVFQCSVSDRYGCEEVGLIASECEKHEGMHLNTDHLYVEFLNPNGRPVKPGEEGLIVVTDLTNRAMPLIRYAVGDRGVPSRRQCTCGRGLPLMDRVTGRMADFLVRADGGLVAGVSLIERTLTDIPGLSQMQIVQPSLKKIVIKIVPDNQFTPDSNEKLMTEMRNVFGEGTEFQIEKCSHLEQDKNGKYRFSICRLPSNYQLAATD